MVLDHNHYGCCMNPSRRELIRFAKKPRVTVVRDKPPRAGTPFYIAVGVACALGVLIIIGTAVLFLRETRHAEAATVQPVAAPAEAGAPVVAAEPEPAATTLPDAPAARISVFRVPRATRHAVEAKAFHGTIWPPQEGKAEAVKPEIAGLSVPDKAEVEPAAEPKEEVAAAEPATGDEPDGQSADKAAPHRVKRVFGALIRPFRGR